MSNSTAMVATIGAGALGLLAYYGYQNMNTEENETSNDDDNAGGNFLKHKEDTNNNDGSDVDEIRQGEALTEHVKNSLTSIRNFVQGSGGENNSVEEDEDDNNNNNNNNNTDLQQQAKEEVTRAISGASNAWGSFWKDEYTSMLEENDKKEAEE